MPHLHTGDGEKDFTVSGYVVNDDRVLQHLHRKLKLWLAPGGHVEWDQDPMEALYDELEQESGLTRDTLELIATNSLQREINRRHSVEIPTPFDIDVHPIPMHDGSSHYHIDFAYVLRSSTDEVAPQPGESQIWEWMDAGRLIQIADQTSVNSLSRSLLALKIARGEA